ncbi:MAG: DUF4111 domain-containing protein [Actinobacteria bacterium]|nr:DUF4111 domain-containing protein [Actinomycetota bacterium]
MNSEKALETAHQVTRGVLESVRQPVDGIVLHGSLASAAYEPGRSDIDLLVVLGEPLQPASKNAVFQAVADLLAPSPTAIDLRFTTRATAAAPSRLPNIDLEIAAHPPDNALQIVAENTTDPDLLNEFAICRAYGRTMHGRTAREMISPVRHDWLLEIADNELATWQRVHAQGYVPTIVPLTACRIWRYATERVFCSKHEAAHWALERAPDCDVIVKAMRAHQGQRDGDLDAATLPQLLTRARDAVAKALARSSSGASRE